MGWSISPATWSMPKQRWMSTFEPWVYRRPSCEVAIRYETPARYDDLLGVRIWVSELSSPAVRFGFEIERAGNGVQLARGVITCVAIGPDWRARSIPPP